MLVLGSVSCAPKEPCPSVSSPEDVIVITGRVWQQVFAGPCRCSGPCAVNAANATGNPRLTLCGQTSFGLVK